ncbi:MAG TPA: ABC transporter substrate-binding protein [Chloroflexota bacterium]|nr:ABC transporter substrate-binding protein [Chloroflexota bacterium]
MTPVARPLTLGVLLALALAACGPAAAPARPAPAATSAPAAAGSASAPAAPSPPPLDTIKVAFAADAAIYAPYFIAMDKGYYAEEGLAIDMVKAGGGAATPALISGDLQYSTSATSAVSAAIQGAPLKVILTSADRVPYQMWSSTPEIHTLAELAGKTVGVQARGDTFEIATRLLLHKHGLDPNGVVYTAIGTGNQRLVAMQTGSVAAMPLDTGIIVQLKAAGFPGNLLADFEQEVRMPYQGAATTDAELAQHRDRAKRFLRATLKGREYFKTYRDGTVDVLLKYNTVPRDANEADYDDTLPTLTEDGTVPLDDARADALLRAQTNGIEQVPPAEQMYDFRLVREAYQELKASGWQPAP